MMLLGFGKRKTSLRVVVDVGSHTTKAVIFEAPTSPGKKSGPRIVKKMVLKLPLLYEEDRVVAKLREFIFAVVRELECVPDEITIALSTKLLNATFAWWPARVSLEGNTASSVQLADVFYGLCKERQIADCRFVVPAGLFINGYPIRFDEGFSFLSSLDSFGSHEGTDRAAIGHGGEYNRIDKLTSGSDVRFHVFELRPSEKTLETLVRMQESLGGLPMRFIPLVLAQKTALVHACAAHDAVLVDMGGEETVVTLVKGGELMEVSSFPMGARHFLRGLSKITSLTFDEAEDLKRQYAQGIISSAMQERIRQFLAKESVAWQQHFIKTVTSFYQYGPLSGLVYLTGGGAHLPEIRAVLQDISWLGGVSYAVKPELRVLEAQRFFQGDSLGGFLQGTEEAGLASLIVHSLFYKPIFS